MPRKNKNARGRPGRPRSRVNPKPKLRRPRPGMQLVTISVQRQHRINGIVYGPGTMKVRANIADVLREQDQRAGAEENKLRTQNERAVIVGPGWRGLRINEVPAETFDDSLSKATPIGRFGE